MLGTTKHGYILNIQALGLVVSDKKIFHVFLFLSLWQPCPWAWPIWTPGAWLAGFIKRITKHCYKQYVNALGLMVSEKKIVLWFS